MPQRYAFHRNVWFWICVMSERVKCDLTGELLEETLFGAQRCATLLLVCSVFGLMVQCI